MWIVRAIKTLMLEYAVFNYLESYSKNTPKQNLINGIRVLSKMDNSTIDVPSAKHHYMQTTTTDIISYMDLIDTAVKSMQDDNTFTGIGTYLINTDVHVDNPISYYRWFYVEASKHGNDVNVVTRKIIKKLTLLSDLLNYESTYVNRKLPIITDILRDVVQMLNTIIILK